MSKSKKRNDRVYPLFDLIARLQEKSTDPGPGSLNIQYQLQAIVSDCIKHCSLSRWEIAGKMSALLNTEISKYMLDTWTAESKEYHRFPAEYLPAFCEAAGSYESLRFLAEKAGVFVLPGPEALRAETQKLKEERLRIDRMIRRNETFIEAYEDESKQ